MYMYVDARDQDCVNTARCFHSEVCIIIHDIVLFASLLHGESCRGRYVQEAVHKKMLDSTEAENQEKRIRNLDHEMENSL